ncbi:MAG: hypothetical protein Q9191_004977 [Dirinaria sp. TL-2023a]
MEDPEQPQNSVMPDSLQSPSSNEGFQTSPTQLPVVNSSEDQVSDNETSEGPVREKLKKTSIASIPRQSELNQHTGDRTGEPSPSIAQVLDNPTSTIQEAATQLRGRPTRKRSFDETGTEKTAHAHNQPEASILSGRERKRSKEVSSTRSFSVKDQEQKPASFPVLEDAVQPAQAAESGNEAPQVSERSEENEELVSSASVHPNSTDQEMQDSVFSPRKKRSRDQWDAELQREQKIIATEESKAHRRSEEHERQKDTRSEGEEAARTVSGTNMPGDDVVSGSVKVYPAPCSSVNLASVLMLPQNGTDAAPDSAPTTAPATSSVDTQSTVKPSSARENSSTRPDSKALGYDFSNSAFGAFSKSSVSPFAIGSSTGNGLRTFASPTPSNLVETAPAGQTQEGSRQLSSNGFPGNSMPAGPGTKGEGLFSLFGGGGSSNSNGTAFGAPSPFAKPLGAPKLTSFANPTGGNNTFGTGGPIKPIGDAKDSDDEKSGSEGEGQASKEFEADEEETDPRFQYQEMDTGEEGEDPVFTCGRAKLYGWEGKWKERGTGILKFNVSTSLQEGPDGPQRKARFIMRAHQTYRVLLNSPVFKEMKIGDLKGNEPAKKQVSIAVIEDGKPTPYLINVTPQYSTAFQSIS